MASTRDKLALMTPAFTIAAAVMANLADELKADPEGLDPSVVQSNEMGWRLARTFHAWLCASIQNETYWPKPPEGVSQVELLEVSSRLAAGHISNLPDALPMDVEAVKPEVVQANSTVFRIWRTIYGWLCLSMTNDELWVPAPNLGGTVPPVPSPVVPGGGVTPALTAQMIIDLLTPAVDTPMIDPLVAKLKTKFLGG